MWKQAVSSQVASPRPKVDSPERKLKSRRGLRSFRPKEEDKGSQKCLFCLWKTFGWGETTLRWSETTLSWSETTSSCGARLLWVEARLLWVLTNDFEFGGNDFDLGRNNFKWGRNSATVNPRRYTSQHGRSILGPVNLCKIFRQIYLRFRKTQRLKT